MRTALAELKSELGVLRHSPNVANQLDAGPVSDHSGVSDDVPNRAGVGDDEGRPGRQGLKRLQPESLILRGLHDAECMAVVIGELLIAQPTSDVHSVA